jgi:hypothetical protein
MEAPPRFAYLQAKAERYLEVGPAAYRAGDFFSQPPADCPRPLLAAIERGMEQVCRSQGYSPATPFEHLWVDGFYALLDTLHFGLERQAIRAMDTDTILDAMHMKHRVTDQSIVLYNKVTQKRRKTARGAKGL